MTKYKTALDKLKKQQQQVTDQLKKRLAEIEQERAQILADLKDLGEQPKINGRSRRHDVRNTILDVLDDAGPSGATADIVYKEVLDYVPNTQRSNVLSHLSRLKTSGDIVVEGSTGWYTYISKNHVKGEENEHSGKAEK